MKFLFFVGSPLSSTALIFRVGNFARILTEAGHEVKITAVGDNYCNGQRNIVVEGHRIECIGQGHYIIKEGDAEVNRLNLFQSVFESIKTILRGRRVTRKYNPDIVHTFTSLPSSLGIAICAKWSGWRTFIDIDDLSAAQAECHEDTGRLAVFLIRLIEDNLPLLQKRITVNSSYLHEKYKNSTLIPNTLSVAEFDPAKHLSARGSRQQELKDKTVIAFISSITRYHGHFEIVDYLARNGVTEKYPEIIFLFVGGGSEETRLRDVIKESGQNIVMTGQIPQEEVKKYLAVCDVGLLPLQNLSIHKSRHPLKLLEYMASETAVVANAVGEVKTIIRNGENGWTLPAGDIENLVKTAINVAGDPALRERMVAQAKSDVEEFDLKNVGKKLLSFYRL